MTDITHINAVNQNTCQSLVGSLKALNLLKFMLIVREWLKVKFYFLKI